MRHGMSKSKLYISWQSMKRRCDFPDDLHKKYYSDKGITYCDEWKDFLNFRDWALANGYVEGYTIERLDNNKGYNPQNCKWIPKNEQPCNRSVNHFVTINDETKSIGEWCKEYNIKWTTFYERMRRGKKGEELLKGV